LSGEIVEIIKRRAEAFLSLGRELMERGMLDLASFNIHQACQLRIKATTLRLFGEIPKIHGIRELLGILAKKLEEIGWPSESSSVVNFVRQHRDSLTDLESAYTGSRCGLLTYTRNELNEMVDTALKMFSLLDGVEKDVLG